MQTQASVKDLMDCDVTDQSGHKIGTVKQVYLNDVSGEPEWVRVHTGLFGTKESFVPLADARHTGDALTIPYDKDKVKHAPQVDADQHLSREQVADLYRYYGLRAPQQQRGTVPGQVGTAREGRTRQPAQPETGTEARGEQVPGQAPRGEAMGEQARREQTSREEMPREGTAREEMTGRERRARTDPTAKPETMAAAHGRVAGERGTMAADEGLVELTLSEERLRVGTERHESERVRLRKRVEIEHIERTVPVYREELRIEREPIAEGEATGAAGRFQIGEDEREFILHEERPVIAKETVPVERIRVRAERVAGEQTVRDEIRKERIDVSHDAGEGMTGEGMRSSGGMGEQMDQESGRTRPGAQNRQRPGRHERR